MVPDVPVPSSELSHKTVLIYIFVFLLIVGAIGAALYFFVFKKKSCKIDSDCSTGEICHDGKCQKLVPSNKCKSDNDCGNNQVCDINSGKCIAKPSQKQCQQDEDCGNGSCINNKCVFANFIVAFDIANLPDGWVECDGNNGTPDIQGRFIKGCTADDKNFGKPGGAIDYSNHMLTLAETYHEHVIPAQALDTKAKMGSDVSCFYDYSSMKNTSGNYDGTNSYPQYTVDTVYTDTPPASDQTAIDLRPKCTSVIFAMPLYNATNFFPVGSIIWLYVENSQPPSLSNSDWKYYSEGTDGFFIGRKDTNPPGDTFGKNTITLTSSNIPSHVHLFYYPLYPDFQNKCAQESDNNRSCPDGNIFRTDDPYPSNIKKTSHDTNNNTSSSSLEILPPYQSLFCIKKTNSNINDIQIGSICAWNSTIIPEGWAICNGKKNTPDLTSRFILNEEKDNTLKQGGKNSIILKDIIPQHYHTYNFVQYICGNVNNCSYDEDYSVNISDCNSVQVANGGDIFPIVAMCDNNGDKNNNNNCIFDNNNTNNVVYSATQPVNLPPPPAPYSKNQTNPPTSITLDPPHIKLIYIMKTS